MSSKTEGFNTKTSVSIPDIHLLKTVGISLQGRFINVGSRAHRAVFAKLALRPGELIATESLVEWVWDDTDDRPKTAGGLIRGHISDLREALPGGRELLPKAQDGAYRLRVKPEHVDLHRFRGLHGQARALVGQDDVEAARLFREALGLWGVAGTAWEEVEPLGGLRSSLKVESHRSTLREEYKTTLLDCLDLELDLGRHTWLISELTNLAEFDPPDERAAMLLMLALYRCNRQVDATNVYRRTRERLTENGIDPSEDLDRLHEQILNRDPALNLSADARKGAIAGAATPGGHHRPKDVVAPDAARLVVEHARAVQAGGTPRRVSTGLFERVRFQFHGDVETEQLLARVEESPDDVQVVWELERVLEVQMRGDAAFSEEVKRMVKEAQQPDQSTNAQVVADEIKNSLLFNEKVEINEGGFNVS